MPLYSFRCLNPDCGAQFDRLLRLKDYAQPQECPRCGKGSERQILPVAVMGDYAGYSCPVTGAWIEGRKAHQENLRRHGCRVLEPGETQQAARAAERADDALADRIAETAAAAVAQMPAAKQEQLGRELAAGAHISITRL